MHFLSRTIRTSFQNIARNKVLSIAIFMVMTIALFVFQLTIATNLVTDSAIALVHKQIDLSVELHPGVQDFQIEGVISAVKNLETVRDAVYVDKETALENFRQHHTEIVGFLDEYGIENPLPNTIFILTDSPNHHTSVLNFLEQPEYSGIVNTSSSFDRIKSRVKTTQLIDAVGAIKQFAMIFTVLLLVFSIFTIWNTIRVVMHARKEEMEIMNLVGASPGFMRAPYLWEGLWFGLGSAVLATFFTGVVLNLASSKVAVYLTNEPMIFISGWSGLFSGAMVDLSAFFGSGWFVLFLLASVAGAFFGGGSALLGTVGKGE